MNIDQRLKSEKPEIAKPHAESQDISSQIEITLNDLEIEKTPKPEADASNTASNIPEEAPKQYPVPLNQQHNSATPTGWGQTGYKGKYRGRSSFF
ncbi:MAG: hypothetical protein ACMXX5_00790 [Candidatus Woesearchaeota archaeon]